MVVELISVGTELLLGNIVNTNAAFLAEKCAGLGLSLSLIHISIVSYAMQYRTEEENSQTAAEGETEAFTMPPSEEDFTVGGVVSHGNLISVYHESYTYEGGAHGMPGRNNHIFDKKTGKELTLASLINLSNDELNTMVRDKFLEVVENLSLIHISCMYLCDGNTEKSRKEACKAFYRSSSGFEFQSGGLRGGSGTKGFYRPRRLG